MTFRGTVNRTGPVPLQRTAGAGLAPGTKLSAAVPRRLIDFDFLSKPRSRVGGGIVGWLKPAGTRDISLGSRARGGLKKIWAGRWGSAPAAARQRDR